MLLEKKVWLREWQEVFGEEGVAGDSLEVFGEEGMAEGDVTEEEGVTEGVAGEAWRCSEKREWQERLGGVRRRGSGRRGLEVFGEEGVAGESWRCYWRRGWNWEVFNCCIYYICMYVGSNIYHS